MTIEILPARLANQIAAGEVVERPASVIKELVENSLDAGATVIHIDVDKGGVKRLRLSDNGSGIAKDELTLALSRHATSKIKNLNDLEAINSLGFRGEALASISSVARLTLTSKPQSQQTAWQAQAEGRDMAVTISPAAHPNGTTIEVLDLFFNTPARRKFLRTEKTEFNHVDEVVRRIALARFDVDFTLTHNGKIIRQYRAATNQTQNAKRVAMICGQKFIEQSIEVDCQHDNMQLTGWLAKPSFARNQNDLSYSYVNGRMMRDKLINHAIRQAYADLLPPDSYPAFVLFLSLDYREVDVNVHPAKHEVRFHQSRYVHDFIYSVCHKALLSQPLALESSDEVQANLSTPLPNSPAMDNVQYERPNYVQPLQQVKEATYRPNAAQGHFSQRDPLSRSGVQNYQKLMTPSLIVKGEESSFEEQLSEPVHNKESESNFFLMIEQSRYGVFKRHQRLHLLSLVALSHEVNKRKIMNSWQQTSPELTTNLISQRLLLPVVLTLSDAQMNLVREDQARLALVGITCVIKNKSKQQAQINQFPAILRDQDVTSSFTSIVDRLLLEQGSSTKCNGDFDNDIVSAIAEAMNVTEYSVEQAQALWLSAKKELSDELIEAILLNSIPLDLTSEIKQLKAMLQTKKN